MKKKLIAGAVAIGILSGAGFAFANSDAGGSLKSWYDGVFNDTKASVHADSLNNAEEAFEQWGSENEGLKEKAAVAINTTKDQQINRVGSEITTAKEAHIQSLEAQKAALMENMNYQFYSEVFLEGYLAINRLGDEALLAAGADYASYTASAGDVAVNEVTQQLNAAKENAVVELQEAIDNAKRELLAELDRETEISTRNLNSQITWKVDDLRKAIKNITAGLLEEQQAIIIAKAQELEDEAKASLDAVVSGLGN